MRAFTRSFALAALLNALGAGYTAAHAEDMVLYATPGYIEALRTKEMMHMIDRNKSGKVSRNEWRAYQERVFDTLDKDKDGFLEPKEFYNTTADTVIPFATLAYTHALMTKQMFGKIDADGDGTVSKEEYLNFQMKIFDMMDTRKTKELGVADFILQKPSH